MPKSNTMSRTAQAVLADAAARNDHLAVAPEHLPTAAKRAVVQSLLKAGLTAGNRSRGRRSSLAHDR